MINLFIGLGGTGAEVLQRIRSMMTAKERSQAAYLHLDTDQGKVQEMIQQGIESVRISNADSVRDIAHELGREDGVYEWLPTENEDAFLTDPADDGAGQNRMKSRLCIARFLSGQNNALIRALEKGRLASGESEATSLRIIIVSSLAGGTGSGTFLDVALTVRKFYGTQRVRITGIFAMPELYTRENQNNRDKVRAMFANAYAAVRELNAMNLSVGASSIRTNDYGKSINIKIDTISEGKLFDSNDPAFTQDYASKPFDLIYFIDRKNSTGRVLGSLPEYYQAMADIAYTRLYSALEKSIESDESNELSVRSRFPTAIYGSAGYAKIVYPYEDILRYLALRRISEEIDVGWTIGETAWNGFKERAQRDAQRSGAKWKPAEGERDESFISTLGNAIAKKNSDLAFLEGQLREKGEDRVDRYLETLEKEIMSEIGISKEDLSDDDPGGKKGGRKGGRRNGGNGSRMGVEKDGAYSLATIESVRKLRDELTNEFIAAKIAGGSDLGLNSQKADPMDGLNLAAAMLPKLESYKDELFRVVKRQASVLADAILPLDGEGREVAALSDPKINLHSALLKIGNLDVHPLAARYLLYRLRKELNSQLAEMSDSCGEDQFEMQLERAYREAKLVFDPDPEDDEELEVNDYLEDLNGSFWSFLPSEKAGRQDDLKDLLDKIGKCMENFMLTATRELKYQAITTFMPLLNALIAQYENFFENLTSLSRTLEQRRREAEMEHEGASGGHIFVGADKDMKDYYYRSAPGISDAIAQDRDEISAMEGKDILTSMLWRAYDKLRMMQEDKAYNREDEETEEDYTDLNKIFDRVIERYADSLRKSVDYLKMDAALALVRSCCRKLKISESRLLEDEKATIKFRDEFQKKIADLKAKSRPLVYYRNRNLEQYYAGEQDVTAEYLYLAVSPQTASTLSRFFPSGEGASNSLEGFKNTIELDKLPVVKRKFSSYEISIFQAVHCLQPTQVENFHETSDNSYYKYYREKVSLALSHRKLSETPHLDKRWYRRGAMPYISRNLELQWRSQLMKAFLYKVLTREIGFTTADRGSKCFLCKRNGRTDLIHWPGNELVLRGNVSRVLEYLAEDEIYVEELADLMDKAVKHQVWLLADDTESPATYKAGMTKNRMLLRLRTDLISALRPASSGSVSGQKAVRPVTEKTQKAQDKLKDTQEKLRSMQKLIGGSAEETTVKNLPERQASMGGLLEVAWLIHQSEEKLGEDRDFAESLLTCAMEVVDKICQGMNGGTTIDQNSTQYEQYRNLYNSYLQKFVRDYVIDVLRSGTLLEKNSAAEIEKMLRQGTSGIIEEEEEDVIFSMGTSQAELTPDASGDYPELQFIPQAIRDSDAFVWLQNHWILK